MDKNYGFVEVIYKNINITIIQYIFFSDSMNLHFEI